MKSAICSLLTASLLTAAPAFAKDIAVSRMKYTNYGSYDAYLYVRYNLPNGENCTVEIVKEAETETGKTTVYNLLGSNFHVVKGPKSSVEDHKIPVGERLWGKLSIDLGDQRDCKTNDRLILAENGKTVVYSTGGTTLHNNRCRKSFD